LIPIDEASAAPICCVGPINTAELAQNSERVCNSPRRARALPAETTLPFCS
jgi:hypothetical protein